MLSYNMPTQIMKVPWWYWPAACVPGLVCAAVLWAAFRCHEFLLRPFDAFIMAGSVYIALVLLGYLLLALCTPTKSSEPASENGKA